jgi:hypothetical protein
MSGLAKIAVVTAGYAAAVGAGWLAAVWYDARVAALPYDTSGGMYAGGQMITSLGAFLAVSLVPTALALWFLRSSEKFWNVVAAASLAFAVAGLLAVLLPLVTGHSMSGPLALLTLFALSQLLGVPLWLAAFGLFALLAPTRESRRRLLGAVGIELAIAACALVHWFVPRPPF